MKKKLMYTYCFLPPPPPDEAWFSLRREVNSQNNRYWSAENQRLIDELPVHDEKCGVWCTVILRHYSSIRLKELSKTTKPLSQDSRFPGRYLNSGPPEYEARVFTTRS
jgi:hypothetical protein